MHVWKVICNFGSGTVVYFKMPLSYLVPANPEYISSSVAVSVVVVPSMGMEFLELGWARRLPSADLRLPADAPEPAAEAEEEPVVDRLEEVMEEE